MKTRLEWKVGLFVLTGLTLLAVLLIGFSKGTTFFHPTYAVLLHAGDISGLQDNSAVLMSGVKVGNVRGIQLAPDGRSVTITLRIYREIVIHRDASFSLEQSGFLGDQFVSIQPNQNREPPLKDMEEKLAEDAVSIQTTVRGAKDLIKGATNLLQRLDQTVGKLDNSVEKVQRLVLNEETLSSLSLAIGNLKVASSSAGATLSNLNRLVLTNELALNHSSSNLAGFSERMNSFAGGLNDLLATNQDEIHLAIKNVEGSTESLKNVLDDLQAGKGLAGNLLKNEQWSQGVSNIVQNLSITTSNLNRLGLWGILRKQKVPRGDGAPVSPLLAPKHAF